MTNQALIPLDDKAAFKAWRRGKSLWTSSATLARLAAQEGAIAPLRYLLKRGYGRDGIVSAARRGELRIVQNYHAAGADINVQDRYGDGALHDAARGNHVHVIEWLLQAGADPNLYNRGDHKPYNLTHAAECRDLLAPPEIKNRPKKTETGCGWSAVRQDGIDMLFQTVVSPDGKTKIRNVFDFIGETLTTEFTSAGNAPHITEKKFSRVSDRLLDEARRQRDAAAVTEAPRLA